MKYLFILFPFFVFSQGSLFGILSNQSQGLIVGTPSTGVTPSNFYYSDVERTFVTLNWDSVSGVDGYKVYLDNSLVGTTSNTTYTVSGLATLTNYDFAVTSYTGANESAKSVLPNVLTGLFPDEEITPIVSTYSIVTEPTNTTPYTNIYGLTERKVSQRSVLGDVPEVSKDYSKMPLWNRNETELRSQSPFEFYDATTYALKADRTVSNVWGYESDNSSYRLNENKFQKRSADGATLTTIRTFSEYDNISIAPTAETQPDWSGTRWSLQGVRSGQMYLFTYDSSTDTKYGEVAIPDVAEGWTATSPYGNYAVVLVQASAGETNDQLAVYDFETLELIGKNFDNHGHTTLQVSIQGNEVMAGRVDGTMRMYLLNNPSETKYIFGSAGGSDFFQLGHASGVNFKQAGWVFFEDRNPDAIGSVTWETGKRVYRKVMSVCLDENKSGVTNVLTRTYARLFLTEQKSFVATPNPTGEKVGFNNYATGANNLEFYVAQRTTGENTNPPTN